jgi:hypothetical protein
MTFICVPARIESICHSLLREEVQGQYSIFKSVPQAYYRLPIKIIRVAYFNHNWNIEIRLPILDTTLNEHAPHSWYHLKIIRVAYFNHNWNIEIRLPILDTTLNEHAPHSWYHQEWTPPLKQSAQL